MTNDPLRGWLESQLEPPTYAFIQTKEIKDLSALVDFPSITNIYLYGATKKRDLSPLAQLPALESVSFHEPTPDLSIIARLPALRSLDLSACKGADLSQLAGAPLEHLTLPKKAVELSGLVHLPRLKHLTLNTGFSGLRGLALELESLDVREQVDDLSAIMAPHAVRSLGLHGSIGLKSDQLEPFVNLTHLTLSSCGLGDVSGLRGLVALEVLDLSSNKGLSDLSPLAGLTALEHLNLYKTGVADVSALSGLSALGYLNMSKTKLSSLMPLAGLSALTALYAESTKLKSLSGVEGLSALETLDVSRTKITDLAPLASLSRLTHLNIERLGAPQHAAVVGQLPALQWLFVDGTTFDPHILAAKPHMQLVRGCEYPPPGSRRLDADQAPLPAEHMGAGSLLDGRWSIASLPGVPFDLALSADGEHAACALYYGAQPGVVVVRAVDGAVVATYTPQRGEVYTGASFGPDGALWLAHHDGYDSHSYRLERWDWRAEPAPVRFANAMSDGLARLYASPDGSSLALVSAGYVQLIDAEGVIYQQLDPAGERHYEACALAWSADSRAVYWCDAPSQITRFDVQTGEVTGRWQTGELARPSAITVSDDGRWIVAQGMHARQACCVDTRSGEQALRAQLHERWASRAAAVSPDGSLVVTCSQDLRAHRLPDGQTQEGASGLGLGGASFSGVACARSVACFMMVNWRDPSRLVFARLG